jgi:transcriptional regulator with XRE-family HTH domain
MGDVGWARAPASRTLLQCIYALEQPSGHGECNEDAMNENSLTLGNLMRTLRTSKGWTRKEMSDRTGIPLSTLAKVENDQLTLGYDKLLQISQRLNMRMSELLADGDDAAEPRAMTRRSVGTLDTAMHVNTNTYDYYFLCPDLRKKRMIPIFGRPHARTLEEFGELVRHAGEEFIFVISGRVEIHTEFYQPVTLEAGQCIYIDSGMGHAYLLGRDCDEASVISGCTSEEDKLLVSLNKPEQNSTHEVPGKPANTMAKRPRKTATRGKASRR